MMRHQSSSIWLVRLLVASLLGGGAAEAQSSAAGEPTIGARVRGAITEAVRARMGDAAEVDIGHLEVTGEPGHLYLQAVPEPDARVGTLMHFRLLGSDGSGAPLRPAGSASAVVAVEVDHVRARVLVPRGRALQKADVEASRSALDGVPLRRLPVYAEVEGARALVNIAPGEVLSRTSVAARPAVKSGQTVRAVARIDGLEVTASLVAAQDGAPGTVIRVVNRESRRELRARVVESGVVEVVP
ncbi:MAG: flagellar basal body P-ring formation chaperone FlgA [Vicinamibacterales bacterium]